MPIALSLTGRPCLVVGGGTVALRKLETLFHYECDITVIAPEPLDRIEYFASKKAIKLEKREYCPGEAESYRIVISASDNKNVNKQVYEDCKAANVPVNVVDNPSLCDFIFPAVVKRDCLTISIASDGQAPFLARHLRLILESIFPERWGKLAKLAASFRKRALARWKNDPEKRAASFARFLEADWKSILAEANDKQLEQLLDSFLESE